MSFLLKKAYIKPLIKVLIRINNQIFNKEYSKKDLFLKIEDVKSTGVSVSSIFKKIFEKDLKTLLS
jgi:hypothetical protein